MTPLLNQDSQFALLESDLQTENTKLVHEIKNTNSICQVFCCLDLEIRFLTFQIIVFMMFQALFYTLLIYWIPITSYQTPPPLRGGNWGTERLTSLRSHSYWVLAPGPEDSNLSQSACPSPLSGVASQVYYRLIWFFFGLISKTNLGFNSD